MSEKKSKEFFLNKKPYMMSVFVSYAILILILSMLSLCGMVTLDGSYCIWMFVGVVIACSLMYFTDQLPISNNLLIAFVNLLDIVISIFGINLLFGNLQTIKEEWWLILLIIIGVYVIVCVIFLIEDHKSANQVNEKIRQSKNTGGNHGR